MHDAIETLEEAAVARLLAAVDPLTMPETVWARLQAALTLEAANRSAIDECHPEPVTPVLEKNALPESLPSALDEG